MPLRARLFIGLTSCLGVMLFSHSMWQWHCDDLPRFACYLAVALVASGLKVQLPGIDGTMSVNFLFILLGILELGLPETVVIGCAATLVQSVWHTQNKPDPVKVLFNVFSMMANAIVLSYVVYHHLARFFGTGTPLLLIITAIVYFLANTLSVSLIISLTEQKACRKVWAECYFWSFP